MSAPLIHAMAVAVNTDATTIFVIFVFNSLIACFAYPENLNSIR